MNEPFVHHAPCWYSPLYAICAVPVLPHNENPGNFILTCPLSMTLWSASFIRAAVSAVNTLIVFLVANCCIVCLWGSYKADTNVGCICRPPFTSVAYPTAICNGVTNIPCPNALLKNLANEIELKSGNVPSSSQASSTVVSLPNHNLSR